MTERERRRYERIHFERQVRLDFFTEVYDDCQVKNISLGGMYISGNFPPDIEDRCYVNFVQTGKNTYLTLEALARVVRRDEEGIGLQFTSMSFDSLMSLEMILLFQAREKSPATEIHLPKDLPFEVDEQVSSVSDKYNTFLDQSK